MSVTLQLRGVNEMIAALRTLPTDLAHEATAIINDHAAGAAAQIRQGYGAHRRSGELADHVTVVPSTVVGANASAQVKATAGYAAFFEYGTAARETKKGANRGAMPPGHVFWPAVDRQYRVMLEDLIALVQRHGLVVRR
jgi:hypothetical protein